MSDILQSDIDIPIEYDVFLEYQIEDYISILFSTNTETYYVQFINSGLEEEQVEVTESDFPFKANNYIIGVEDFTYFKTLTKNEYTT